METFFLNIHQLTLKTTARRSKSLGICTLHFLHDDRAYLAYSAEHIIKAHLIYIFEIKTLLKKYLCKEDSLVLQPSWR